MTQYSDTNICVSSGYVIVIVRCQGFMAVNELSPRAQPEDEVCFTKP